MSGVYAMVFCVSLAVSYFLPFPLRRLARRYNLVDEPADRTIHLKAVPTIGGVAIWVSFFLAVIVGVLLSHGQGFSPAKLRGLFYGSTIVFVLGLYDDLRSASAAMKMLVQVLAALVLIAFGYQIRVIASPLGGAVSLGPWGIPLTLIWVVGIVNAVNLIDGLDGLAAGICAIAGISLFATGFLFGFGFSSLLATGVVGSALGFLRHNFYPARIFMGDTGSMFLGFCLAAISLGGAGKSVALVALLIPLVALGLPILDTLLAVMRRTRRRVNIFQSDKEHIHHKLLESGLSHRRVVLLLYGASSLFGALAVGLATADRRIVAAIALLTMAVAASGGLILRRFRRRALRN